MPAGNDTASHEAFKQSVESQYGPFQNAEELVRAHQVEIDPAVRRAGLTQIDVKATDALREEGLGVAEDRFQDLPDGWELVDFAVRGNALVGVFQDDEGLFHKLVTGANDRYEAVRLTPNEQSDRAAAEHQRRVIMESARLRHEADEKIAKVRSQEEARIQKELERIRADADETLAEAQTAAREEAEAGSGSGDDEEGGDADATEGARALAEAEGVDLSEVEGTGKDGRVTQADVEKHLAGASS